MRAISSVLRYTSVFSRSSLKLPEDSSGGVDCISALYFLKILGGPVNRMLSDLLKKKSTEQQEAAASGGSKSGYGGAEEDPMSCYDKHYSGAVAFLFSSQFETFYRVATWGESLLSEL